SASPSRTAAHADVRETCTDSDIGWMKEPDQVSKAVESIAEVVAKASAKAKLKGLVKRPLWPND
ncbi:MAG: hypothetical protein ACOYLQ_18875, partial [Hyphomicrobiaceae bacterium]